MNQVLFNIEFDGSSFYGWQKQKDFPTVQEYCEKILKNHFKESFRRVLSCSRTDAKVHARDFYFILFLKNEISLRDLDALGNYFNGKVLLKNLYSVGTKFNIIKDVASKEYHYRFFDNGGEYSPYHFSIEEELDIKKMKQAAKVLEGEHYFKHFQYKGSVGKSFVRKVDKAEVLEDEKGYRFVVNGKGFLRHQVRIMMGALINIGLGKVTIGNLKDSLKMGSSIRVGFRVPGEGLYLNKVRFQKLEDLTLLRSF